MSLCEFLYVEYLGPNIHIQFLCMDVLGLSMNAGVLAKADDGY
jgi:hypothetical protein